VRRENNRLAFGCQLPAEFKHFHAVAHVKVRRGFIEQKVTGLRSEAAGDNGALAFAAGEGIDGAVAQGRHVAAIESDLDGLAIGG